MKLKYCILLLMFLTITSSVLLSCDDDETVYYSGKDADIKFLPFTSYRSFYACDNKCIVTRAKQGENKDLKYYLVKVGVDGTIDSTFYTFSEAEDITSSDGDMYFNSSNQLFLVNKDYTTNSFTIFRYDAADFSQRKTMTFCLPDEFNNPGSTPLDDGGYAFLAQKMSFEDGTSEWFLYRLDADGNEREPMPLYLNVEDVRMIYSFGNSLIVYRSNWSEHLNIFSFYTFEGKFLNEVIIHYSGMETHKLHFVNNSLYLSIGDYVDGKKYNTFYRLDYEGNVLQKTPTMMFYDYECITEIDGRIYVAGQKNRSHEGKGSADDGIVYSIDRDNFEDIDSIKMKYKDVIPLAVMPDQKEGYNVFLIRRYNYTDEMMNDNTIRNIYIYHVDDLHNLQIDD
ncbi:MAG: hypothetical protein J6T60_14240 [Bacteroidales bacterium]|nr:hypothetical protein [Bacteroidales bacterium]